jgi:membrane-bound inhibitor of C-type lysozyme
MRYHRAPTPAPGGDVTKKTMAAIRNATLAAAVATAVAGCIAYEPEVRPLEMPWGQRVNLACMGDKSMAVDFVPAPRAARVTFDATTVTLPQVEAASDAKFTDGRYTLYISGERAALEETGVVLRGPCRPR